MSKYSVGIDYGTLSARGILIDIHSGEEIASCVFGYPHGVMEQSLPCGAKLPPDWALQHPDDYLNALYFITTGLIKSSGVKSGDIIGIGIDFTSCTILPVTADGTPLCKLPEFSENRHAYVKLWKHHSAQYCADKLNETAELRSEEWLKLYGGKISSEWLVPKAMQIAAEAPEVYTAADRIIEAGDWLVWMMCGREARSACNAGYKALWQQATGYPTKEFFSALDKRLENIVEEKLSNDIKPLGSRAGYITEEMAQKTGLSTETAVAVGIIDAHASVPACGIDGEGKLLMIMGTSTCHIILSEKEIAVPGICGVVKDGVLPGFYAYEAGQSCVGDHFSWFVDNCLPAAYYDEAKKQGINPFGYLSKKAERLRVGESGLLALDWWNGVRSVLMDFDLSGMLVGMTLQTKPEEIYRALVEATAYGTRMIIEAFEGAGLCVEALFAAGGIAAKDPFTMQIYSDVCGKVIRVSGKSQSGALGSAIYAVAAAGQDKSGYKSIGEAVIALGRAENIIYTPNKENVRVYNELFAEYKKLHVYFGRGENNVMKKLKEIKNR
ncbi:MAG: ribulokinase [Firmicutes bacterium HGW-Firmicutes-21]|nr:MAG: ribulokinase [Firmicutes bacterium HGW-Firmicutes-21]